MLLPLLMRSRLSLVPDKDLIILLDQNVPPVLSGWLDSAKTIGL